MTKLSVAAVQRACDGIENWMWNESLPLTLEVSGKTYDLEVVAERYGYDGAYSLDTYVVFKINGQNFKKTGHYNSYEGTTWDGPIVEVEEVEVSTTKWAPVEEDSFYEEDSFESSFEDSFL